MPRSTIISLSGDGAKIGGVLDAPGRFAIVLTHNRPDLLARCVAAISPQVDRVLVIDNASDPPATVDLALDNVLLVHDAGQPPNLSRLWNLGFDVIEAHLPARMDRWNVAVLCDDAIVPDGWFELVAAGMRRHLAAAASTHSIHPLTEPIVKTQPDSDITNRMCGWAFMLAGELGLRADESMQWWFSDTDVCWQARAAGGMVLLPGPVVKNELPNDYTNSVPGLAEQAGRDREAFARKHGSVPW